jgi:hypothetical protein
MNSISRRGSGLLLALCALVTIALTLAAGALPVASPPLLNLGPITILNGTATLTGSVTGASAGEQLTVNGRPLSLDASGQFAATVSLNGASTLDLVLADPAGNQSVRFQIPLGGTTGVLGGVIPSGILDQLEQAGLSLLIPAGGLQTVDGQPLTISGGLLNPGQLAGLSVNGTDVLSGLQPNNSFIVQLPGSTKSVAVTATDKQGTSETRTYSVSQQSTLVQPTAGSSVSANGAFGIRIARIRYVTKMAPRTRRLGMLVTIKDRRGYLIRGATVVVRATRAGRLVRTPQSKPTNRAGQASFSLRLRPQALGKRLVTVTRANTPTATTKKLTSVRIPRSRRR